MNIMMKTKDMEDDYTLELFCSHSLILCSWKKEHVMAQSIFPKYKLWYILPLEEKRWSVASDVEIVLFCI